jgi:NAD(P)-dependent dehydrogenase (short-subunit alcohol dehydrogenase family)
MQELLTNKIVLVTGGTQGVGLAVAEAAAREGATGVAIVGRNAQKAERAAESLSKHGAKALAVIADLAKPGEAERAVAETVAEFGRVDCVVNAAGLTTRGSITGTDRELFDEHLAVNLVAPFMVMQQAALNMQKRGEPGTMVNIITMSSHGGQPFLAPYAASKAGLAAATKNAAHALRFDRIRINGLNIGWTATEGEADIQKRFHDASDNWLEEAESAQPMGQLGRPDEIADAVVFLLSSRSGVVTGSVIDWDQQVVGAYD